MEYNEAYKLAKKIHRCLKSIPDDVRVIITNSSVDVCDLAEMNKYEDENGHLDNPPVIAGCAGRLNVVGFENQL